MLGMVLNSGVGVAGQPEPGEHRRMASTRPSTRAAAPRPDPIPDLPPAAGAADAASRVLGSPPTVADAATALRAAWDVYRSAYTLACQRGHGPELARDHDALVALIMVQAKGMCRQR